MRTAGARLRDVERVDNRYIIYISGIYEKGTDIWKIWMRVFQNYEMKTSLDSGTFINLNQDIEKERYNWTHQSPTTPKTIIEF